MDARSPRTIMTKNGTKKIISLRYVETSTLLHFMIENLPLWNKKQIKTIVLKSNSVETIRLIN